MLLDDISHSLDKHGVVIKTLYPFVSYSMLFCEITILDIELKQCLDVIFVINIRPETKAIGMSSTSLMPFLAYPVMASFVFGPSQGEGPT
jgi:hypothetical protein